MKRKRALELQAEWGDEPCSHPAFAKEYDQGVRTGNFVCTRCGAILGFREKGQIMAERRAAEPGAESDAEPEAGSDVEPEAGSDAEPEA
jgi:hypothetical protein